MGSQLRRYKFSRSVCYRMDLPGPKPDSERDDDGGGDDDDDEEEEEYDDDEHKAKGSSGTPSRCESDRGYSSPKVSYAKSLSASLSLPGADDKLLPKSKSKSKKQLQRLVSWSRYLEVRGNEQASGEWTIDLSKLLLGPKFASGAHSRLYHGIYQGQAVAVKVSRHPQACDKTGNGLRATLDRLFDTEMSFLSKFHHPNLVQFIGACKKPPVNCVVTEYLGGGSLADFLSRSTSPLPLHTVAGMALDICGGMNYLHSQGVVHRDLKSSNLILTDDLSVKITDLGVAALESECDHVTSDVGTYRWMAPELVNRKPHSAKVDIYSFGIVLWELLTRQVPFQDMNPIQAAYAVVNKNARPPLPSNCPSLLCQLMEQCWTSDPSKRPDFDVILQTLHRFQADQQQKFC